MMGNKKLSTIRKELRAAAAVAKSNPIAALDRRIRKLSKNSTPSAKQTRSLVLLRNALAQVVENQLQPRARTRRKTRTNQAT